jgi:hypothetical protein
MPLSLLIINFMCGEYNRQLDNGYTKGNTIFILVNILILLYGIRAWSYDQDESEWVQILVHIMALVGVRNLGVRAIQSAKNQHITS